jgi:hypothetical protein
MLDLRPTRPPNPLNGFSTFVNRSMIFCRKSILITRNVVIKAPNKFQVGDKVWLHLQKEHLTGPHWKLRPLRYGPYAITKAVGDNAFELSIPPFLGLHVVFNVDLLQPYFPPLLDTSEVAEKLTSIELSLDCMEQVTIDQIVDA